MDRVKTTKLILWMLVGLGFAVGVTRFFFGLGATTNLTDAIPWGFWIGFDVMGGVALAAGGFVITAAVYVMRREEFHPIVRPAVLTAFLGYLAVIVGLTFDVGLPWNLWRPILPWNWQFHSALFEVAMCVMFYTTVLAAEFLPVPMESFGKLATIRNFLVKYRLVFVILGIMLSTLHQSSLGSLFLIMPYRVHPLWYSPILPILFFTSAVLLGLMMVSLESHCSSWLYRREPETHIIGKLQGAAKWVAMLYLGIRLVDLIVRGKLVNAFEPSWQTAMFWLELSCMAIIPIVVLFLFDVRDKFKTQWLLGFLGVFGIVLNRINVGGFTHLDRNMPFYIPAWSEIAISAAVVAGFGLIFLFAIDHFNIWEEPVEDPDEDVKRKPIFGVDAVWLGNAAMSARVKNSMAFVLAAAIGFALLSQDDIFAKGSELIPARPARGDVHGVLWIDGNVDSYGVSFKHQFHVDKLGEKSCVRCHHMNLPRDTNSTCSNCHRDMYVPTDAFGHEWHASSEGGKLACFECHTEGQIKSKETAKQCTACHQDLVPQGATIQVKQYLALGYTEAMHQMCIGCHVEKSKELNRPELPRCATCHHENQDYIDDPKLAPRYREPAGKRLIVPVIND